MDLKGMKISEKDGPDARAAAAGAAAGGKPNSRVACVAIISHNNGPLYLKVFPEVASALPRRPEETIAVQMQEVIYNSLDVVEERISSLKATPMRDNDGFLGCLAVVGPLSLYGFVSNTHQRLIAALRTGDAKDAAVRALFRRILGAAVGAFLNPFAELEAPITSARFDARIEDIARRFG